MSVDIIIPTKSNTHVLFRCLSSIVKNTTDTKYHIYIADTGSSDHEIKDIISYIYKHFNKTKNITLLKYDYYNFSSINNDVVINYSTNEYILFCNNDIELIDNCIDTMYQHHIQNEEIGTVGCRLLYPDQTVQHAAQIVWSDGSNLRVSHRGIGTTNKYRNGSVVGNTAALMMISKDVFIQVGMFNTSYTECFEDLELNIKLITNGYMNYYFDSVSATHHESMTRTKSNAALSRQQFDYIKTLIPFWNKLSNANQNNIIKISTHE